MDVQLLITLAAVLAATGGLQVPAASMQVSLASFGQVRAAAQQAVTAPPQPVTAVVMFPQIVRNPLSLQTIVNKKFQLPVSFRPDDLVQLAVPKKADEPLRSEAAKALEQLFAAAHGAGLSLQLQSAFRTFEQQKTLHDSYVQVEGLVSAEATSARPGYSEHQTGLAADIGVIYSPQATAAYAWLAIHAPEFGYIVRYPQDKEAVTGYRYEPWHIRYVGKDLATVLKQKNQTLEEFYGLPGGGYGE